MKQFEANQVINGTFGDAWVDDDYLGEIISGKAEVEVTYSDISRARHLINGKKMTKAEGKGSVKLHHVRTNIAKKMSDAIKSGRTLSVKIIMRLEDPDALGAERVVLYGCKFNKATLMDWEAEKETEESYDFTFEDWDFLDLIIA
jgi:hypothetical protein|nr:MAG TPA: tail tube protein [Caudoviricetes sp.]